MGLFSYLLPDPWASTPSFPRCLRMGQLAWLPTESIAAVGYTLGPVQSYLYKHMCRTQRVIISAKVCVDKEELKEEQEQGGSRSGAPVAPS